MKTYEGYSTIADAELAVKEAVATWPSDAAVDMIFVFHSTAQDASEVARAVSARFPNAQVAGCTTAGEHVTGRHLNGALVLSGISSPKTRWSVTVAEDLATFDATRAGSTLDDLFRGLGGSRDSLDPARHFCITFMDGLSMKEETAVATMAEALSGVALVGGSAGDDLKFKRTEVIANGRAYDNAAVFVLAESHDKFRVLKHQHFVRTNRLLAVTKVDTDRRIVYELDGKPAAEAYARALGISRDVFNADVAFANPLTFECNGELYVRSVKSIEADGSIAFLCGLEKGMVLDVGGHLELDTALAEDLGAQPIRANFLLACNCILRALEAGKTEKHETVSKLLAGYSEHVIGFDTYGEQLNGLHINQTIVGLALGDAE